MTKYGGLGWKPQLPDARDLLHTPPSLLELPALVDMRPGCPAVYDQGQYGSCTANAACGAFEFDLLKQGLLDFMPSRMFEYYNTRLLDHDVHQDGGGTIRNANKALAQKGVCSEQSWPYTGSHLLHKPAHADYTEALPNRITQYMAVSQSLFSVKATLAGGLPIQIGFTVYTSFESSAVTSTGIVPMPDLTRESVLGGHAVLIVGYDDTLQRFIVRNSWGANWGMQGYFTMPYAYFMDPNLASDLWVIQTVP